VIRFRVGALGALGWDWLGGRFRRGAGRALRRNWPRGCLRPRGRWGGLRSALGWNLLLSQREVSRQLSARGYAAATLGQVYAPEHGAGHVG